MDLEVKDVAISIESHRIVNDVSLSVNQGAVVGLIGPNGSGKTTLLRSVYRMLRPEAGYIELGSDDVWKLSARESAQRTGIVVQETPGDFEFTVLEIVEMGRTPHKRLFEVDNLEDEAIVEAALERVGMSDFRERNFNTLSGGEKQRVLVARALAQEPRLLVLDEPTNHLDIRYQLEVLDLVRDLGITTLVTLHDLNLAAAYCNRLYLLSEGCVVTSGPPQDVLAPEWVLKVFGVEAYCERHPITGRLHLFFEAANGSGNIPSGQPLA